MYLVHYFLHEAIKALPNNRFAKAVYNAVVGAGQKTNLETMSFMDLDVEESVKIEQPFALKIGETHDFRVKSVYMHGFRKYPFLENLYYGLPFVGSDGNSCSTLIMGRNGAGKSSVFSALETVFRGDASLANLRGYATSNRYYDFLSYAHRPLSELEIHIMTQEGKFSQKGNKRSEQLLELSTLFNPFFISEYDIEQYTRLGLTEFVYQQMGYRQVFLLIKVLLKEEDYIRQNIDVNSIDSNDIQHIEEKLVQLNYELEHKEQLYTTCYQCVLRFHELGSEKIERIKAKITKWLKRTLSEQTNELQKTLKNLKEEEKDLKKWMGEEEKIIQLYRDVIGDLSKSQEKNPQTIVGRESLVQSVESQRKEEEMTFQQLLRFRKLILENLLVIISELSSHDTGQWLRNLLDDVNEKENIIRQKAIEKDERLRKGRIYNNRVEHQQLLKELERLFMHHVKVVYANAKTIIDKTLNQFLYEGERIETTLSFDNKHFEVSVYFKDEVSGNEVSMLPEQYFNTFRYKLYCQSLKIAIAFSVMELYKMNFPLVIDDVFYSSDFEHRGKVRKFFQEILKLHQEVFTGKLELQVIFLTHDDLIARAAYKGYQDVSHSGVVFGQMFDYREAEDTDLLCKQGEEGYEEDVKVRDLMVVYN